MTIFTNKENLEKDKNEGLNAPVFMNESLRNDLKSHFHAISLSSAQKQALETSLLSYHESSHPSKFAQFFSKNRSVIFSHIATAAAAIVITLGFAYYSHSTIESAPHDLISDVVGLSDNLNFPADFNLDGNLKDLPDLINDSLPNHSFSPAVPMQIAQDFSAYEGRFFLYKGEQGVGISVTPLSHDNSIIPLRLHQGFERSQPSTLYIVKLSDRNRSSFPTQKVSRKIASASGKIKRVYAWRDGTYGYAMVQPLGLGD